MCRFCDVSLDKATFDNFLFQLSYSRHRVPHQQLLLKFQHKKTA